MPLPEGPYARHTARVLLMDKDDRLLLFKFGSRRRGGFTWLTPGGGVDEGEELNAAAARELREETGLIVTPEELGAVVAVTGGHADLGWVKGTLREDYFFHRVGSHDVDMGGFTDFERKSIAEHRWWSIADLESTEENVIPWNLAPLLVGILQNGLPEKFIELPWHH